MLNKAYRHFNTQVMGVLLINSPSHTHMQKINRLVLLTLAYKGLGRKKKKKKPLTPCRHWKVTSHSSFLVSRMCDHDLTGSKWILSQTLQGDDPGVYWCDVQALSFLPSRG